MSKPRPTQPLLSPRIPSGPFGLLFLGVYLGFTMMNLVVDAQGDPALLRAYYGAAVLGCSG